MTTFHNEIINLLKEKKIDELVRLPMSRRKIISILISLSYDKQSLISWRAIEAIGFITKKMPGSHPELIRNTLNRLLWMIRDESGGIGWSAPEIIGEIVRNNPEMCSDIALIIASFHEEKMLSAGVLRAIARIGRINDEFIEYTTPVILSFLQDPEPIIRGHAAWAAGEIGVKQAVSELQKLAHDNNIFWFYEEGELKEKTIGEIAINAIAQFR